MHEIGRLWNDPEKERWEGFVNRDRRRGDFTRNDISLKAGVINPVGRVQVIIVLQSVVQIGRAHV